MRILYKLHHVNNSTKTNEDSHDNIKKFYITFTMHYNNVSFITSTWKERDRIKKFQKWEGNKSESLNKKQKDKKENLKTELRKNVLKGQ